MGLQITVRSDLKEVFSRVDLHLQRQIPFATAKALTQTALQVRQAERAEMERVFDRPTPFTLNALFVKPATKTDLVARVWIKDQFFFNGRQLSHLHPHIFGEQREVKRLEQHLRRVGLLPDHLYVVPGAAAQIDRWGNLNRGQLQKVLSALRAQRDPYQNRPVGRLSRGRAKSRPQEQYFVGRPGNSRLPLGVWQRFTFAAGSAVKPVLIFVRKPAYRVRFRFFDVAQDVVARHLRTNAEAALREAVRSAK